MHKPLLSQRQDNSCMLEIVITQVNHLPTTYVLSSQINRSTNATVAVKIVQSKTSPCQTNTYRKN